MIEISSDRTKILLERRGKLLVGYVLAGYPGCEEFFDILDVINRSSLDIIELGFASSDPYSDGQVIADAHRAVDKSICCSLDYWTRIRKATDKPIWAMAYERDFIESGLYLEFSRAGVLDGVVIPDLKERERVALIPQLNPYGVDVIGFSNPDMSDSELDDVFSTFPLVYEQLYVGQTGKGSAVEMYHHMLEKSLGYPHVVGLAGFGISTCEQVVRKYKEGFRGVIIGTAIVKHLNESLESLRSYISDIGRAKEEWQE